MPEPDFQPREGRGPRRRGRFARFLRGYLMLAGGAATLYALIQLVVRLFVEIGAWQP